MLQLLAHSVPVLVLLLAAHVCACGSGGGKVADAGSSDLRPDGAGVPGDTGGAVALFTGICARFAECKDSPFISSQADCVRAWTLTYDCNPVLSSVSVTGVAACIKSLGPLSCSVLATTSNATRECMSAFRSLDIALGAVGDGEVCESASCLRDSDCVGEGGECLRCESQVQPDEGKRCRDLGCGPGLVCDPEGVCRKPIANGGACTDSEECESGYCGDTGKCARPKIGDACDSNGDCGELSCKSDKCAAYATIGGPCDEEGECTLDAQCVSHRCEPLATCHSVAAGGSCYASAQCAQGLACGEAGCVTPASEGASCMTVPCAPELTCFSDSNSPRTCRSSVPQDPTQCAPSATTKRLPSEPVSLVRAAGLRWPWPGKRVLAQRSVR